MATITEDYVSFETAKLLKEKRFNGPCRSHYMVDTGLQRWTQNYGCNTSPLIVLCPTQQMVMKWLREVHHIEIYISFGFPFIDGKQQYKYFWSVVKVCNNHLEYPMDDPNNADYSEEMADSYEQAVEAGIKYSLEHLI